MGRVDVTPEDRQRLGKAVRAARIDLGMTAHAAATRAKVSPTTWGDIERGAEASVRPLTYAAVERVVGWQPGSVARVLAGDTPLPAVAQVSGYDGDDPGPADHITAWESGMVAEIWAKPNLSDDLKEELTARVRARAAEARTLEDRVRRSAS